MYLANVRPDPRWLAALEAEPLATLLRARRLACCTLTACWALHVAGRAPASGVEDLGQWTRPCGHNWWAAANVWDGTRPWSALGAIQRLLGGEIREPACPRGAEVVVAQDWTDHPGGTPGHIYLWLPVQGGHVLADSTEARGLRISAHRYPRAQGRVTGHLVIPGGLA